MKMFFAPNGKPITSASACSFTYPNIEIDEAEGTSGLGHFDDFPNFEPIEVPGLGNMLMDVDSNEWLEKHCRLVEVDDDHDVWDDGGQAPSWDESIVDACRRAQWLGQTLWAVKTTRDWAPTDIREDPTIKAVFDNIIVGRIEGEMAGLLCRIDAYRAANPDITTLVADEEDEDAAV